MPLFRDAREKRMRQSHLFMSQWSKAIQAIEIMSEGSFESEVRLRRRWLSRLSRSGNEFGKIRSRSLLPFSTVLSSPGLLAFWQWLWSQTTRLMRWRRFSIEPKRFLVQMKQIANFVPGSELFSIFLGDTDAAEFPTSFEGFSIWRKFYMAAFSWFLKHSVR
jgi:hypothetical protein